MESYYLPVDESQYQPLPFLSPASCICSDDFETRFSPAITIELIQVKISSIYSNYLSGSEMNKSGEMLSFGSRQILLLLEASLQFVNLFIQKFLLFSFDIVHTYFV